jgi:superfamily II DNA/RNA helicase
MNPSTEDNTQNTTSGNTEAAPRVFEPIRRNREPNTNRNGGGYHGSKSRYTGSSHGGSSHGSASAGASSEPPVTYDKPKPRELNDEERAEIKEAVSGFEEMGISDNIIRGIFSYGFEKPSIIQARAVRPVLSGNDVIAQAQSGMGKTGAFAIGTLGRIDENQNSIQALVVVHTRELAIQIDTVFRQIAKYTGIRFNLCIKGVPTQENVDKLLGVRGGKPHVVIGTPGRILDMLHRRDRETGNYVINQNTLRMLVIDEADEMLGTSGESYRSRRGGDDEEGGSGGFLDQIFKIFRCMPSDIQVCLFSATMGKEFFDITKDFMRNPLEVLVKTEELTLDGIKQYSINVEQQKYKFDTLCELYGLLTINQSIIYCNSLKSVEYLTKMLRENNFMVSYIHGQMQPQDRELTMADFRSGKSRVLVSTDLLSRGIDIQQVSVVINYDIPVKVESYLHRIGRSGRYGRKGVAINFMTSQDERRVREIERYYSTIIDPLPADINNLLN